MRLIVKNQSLTKLSNVFREIRFFRKIGFLEGFTEIRFFRKIGFIDGLDLETIRYLKNDRWIQMKPAKIDIPVLKDVVVLGKEVPETDEFSPILNELQVKALQQQIEKIVNARLEAALKKATQQAVKDINAHLDKVLPDMIKATNTFNK